MNITALPTPAASSISSSSHSAVTTVAGVRATRVVVTVTSAVIAVCAFAFSFGNIWHLALAWGVPAPIAPLVAPMLDVSVVGLMIAVRQLSLHGVPGRALVGARLLMLTCAVTTWGLNIAQAFLDHRWGGVAIDSVAPALLLGWAEVGPTLLRLTTTPAASPDSGERHVAAVNEAATPVASSDGATRPAMAARDHTAAPSWAATTMSPDEINSPATTATPRRWRTPGNAAESSGITWGSSDGEGDLPHVA
jgi:Protein of unknown function (DUF2637)